MINHFLNLLSWKYFGNKFHQNIEKISEINDSVYQSNGWIWSSLPVKYFYTHWLQWTAILKDSEQIFWKTYKIQQNYKRTSNVFIHIDYSEQIFYYIEIVQKEKCKNWIQNEKLNFTRARITRLHYKTNNQMTRQEEPYKWKLS